MSLVCVRPVLIGNRQYNTGEVLPGISTTYAEVLLKNGIVAEKTEEPKVTPAKATVIVEPGLVGEATPKTGDEPELVGKPPKREERTVAQPTKKRGTKRSE